MTIVAIAGAGPTGAAVAADLAFGRRCSRVVLIDDHADLARGKALDLLQGAAACGSDTRVTPGTGPEHAASAAALVVADQAATGLEWQGEAGLSWAERLHAANREAPIVFAGASHAWLVGRCGVELAVAAGRAIGTAALAFESAVRAIAALEADAMSSDVSLRVVGRPPARCVVDWDSATIAGRPALDRLGATGLRRVDARLQALWPPGPYALAAAAAAVVTALVADARVSLTCLTLLPCGSVPAAWPVCLGRDGATLAARPDPGGRLAQCLAG